MPPGHPLLLPRRHCCLKPVTECLTLYRANPHNPRDERRGPRHELHRLFFLFPKAMPSEAHGAASASAHEEYVGDCPTS